MLTAETQKEPRKTARTSKDGGTAPGGLVLPARIANMPGLPDVLDAKRWEKTDHQKVVVELNGKFGRGLLAIADLPKGEVIAEFDGNIYTARLSSLLPNDPPLCVRDHAVQLSETEYRYSKYGVLMNHSCKPNCGINGIGAFFRLVTMRPIKAGQSLTFDYEMSEDSDWRMPCKCGCPNCRKVIGAYTQMPPEVRAKYKGHIASYLVEKYGET